MKEVEGNAQFKRPQLMADIGCNNQEEENLTFKQRNRIRIIKKSQLREDVFDEVIGTKDSPDAELIFPLREMD